MTSPSDKTDRWNDDEYVNGGLLNERAREDDAPSDKTEDITERAKKWRDESGGLWALYMAAPPHGKFSDDLMAYVVEASDPARILEAERLRSRLAAAEAVVRISQRLRKPLWRLVEESMKRNGPQIDPAIVSRAHDLNDALVAYDSLSSPSQSRGEKP